MTTRPASVFFVALLLAAASLPAMTADAAWRPFAKKQDTEQAAPDADPTVVAQADATERLNRAEARIRELTGQVEELNFKLRQIEKELGIEAGEGVAVVTPDDAGAIVTEAEPLGRLVIDAPVSADQPIDLTAPGSAPRAASGGEAKAKTQVVSLGDPRADYERAYSTILSGDYELAEASFRSFLATYPTDQRAPDAQYWLGESLYARGQYGEAADEFLAGYKAYPKSGKAADTLLKLGLSLNGLGESEAACSTYTEVLRKFPNSSNALRQRVESEKSVAGC